MSTSVVEELVVLITARDETGDVEKKIEQRRKAFEKQQARIGDAEKRRDEEAKKRRAATVAQFKEFSSVLRGIASAGLAVAGVGAAITAAMTAAVTGLAAGESALGKLRVGTRMTNREVSALQATSKAMTGGEGAAGTVLELERQMTGLKIGGDASQLMAVMSSLGIGYKANESGIDLAARAQERYQSLPAAQKQTAEGLLLQQGISADFIQMLRSDKSVKSTYQESLARSADVDPKQVDEVNSAEASLAQSFRSLSGVLMVEMAPIVKQAAESLGAFAKDAAAFAKDVSAAGGGITGFIEVVTDRSPQLGSALDFLRQYLEVDLFVLKKFGEVLAKFYDWLSDKLGSFFGKVDKDGSIRKGASDVWEGLKETFRDVVKMAEADLHGTPGKTGGGGAGKTGGGKASVQDLIQYGISKGLSPNEAAAVAANLYAESAGDPAALNRSGGGAGALGIAQWRGPRQAALLKAVGSNASWQSQYDWMLSDPYERAQLKKALSQGGTAQQLGVSVAANFERTGNASLNLSRGVSAQQYADAWQANSPNGATTGAGGPTITLTGPVSIAANNPQELVSGIQRVSGVQNYNSATR